MTNTVVVDVTADYGPLILGGLLAFGLSGCVNMQFILYWQSYPEERWPTKFLVIATWLLDLCHDAFIAIAIWDSVITSYGDLDGIDVIPWSVGPAVALTAMVTFLVQCFFAYRIYRLQNRKIMVACIVLILALSRLAAASVTMVEMIKLKHYSGFLNPFPSWVFTLGLSLSAFVDILITMTLCYFLRSNRSLAPSTNRIIDTLTRWTVQNGSITCLGACASLVSWLVMPQNRIFLGLHFVVAKLYASSLLSTLNARKRIRDSWKHHMMNQAPTVPMFPQVVSAKNSMRTPSTSCQKSPVSHLDSFAHRRVDLTRGRSIKVIVQRTVESKRDDDEDNLFSVAAESVRETEDLEAVGTAVAV